MLINIANISNSTVFISGSDHDFSALVALYVDKQSRRNTRIYELITLLDGATPCERKELFSALRILQKESETALFEFKKLTGTLP